MAAPLRIACFGDSLTEGYGLSPDEALPAVLERRLRDEGLDVVCLNHGVSGDTAGDGVQRLGSVLAEEPQAVVLEFGANDCFLDEPVEVVEAHLRILIERFKTGDIPVLLVGVNAGMNPDSVYRERFEAIFPTLAKRYGVPLFPDILAPYQGDPSLTLMDGLHPNAAGVEAMGRALLPQVLDLARIVTP
ncbi:arylesterase [Pseudodesulfovibrio indicus]|uniref:Acyl-CoA thioesterase-1 n=1 Tax=Pseudodesulfovibrio indicus TaxID=1716143 RepID=A0A126QPA3_9BACT|nr:arylesterase [Pseudodesulfovibrio indicus]AMK11538.1 arylesterase [Pseudodesulfovibrio indicus]TDT89941.1 acyl-CoA thioesterase-1 [Pseudodesulfovibrio indicus]